MQLQSMMPDLQSVDNRVSILVGLKAEYSKKLSKLMELPSVQYDEFMNIIKGNPSKINTLLCNNMIVLFRLKPEKEDKAGKETANWKFFCHLFSEYGNFKTAISNYSIYSTIPIATQFNSNMDVINEHYNAKCMSVY